jgi:hypothetical protein
VLAGDRSGLLSLAPSSSEQEMQGLLVSLSDCDQLLCRGAPGGRVWRPTLKAARAEPAETLTIA